MSNNAFAQPDFNMLFEQAPGLYMVLDTNLRIVAASNAYLQATLTRREDIVGRHVFDVFPDNPDDPSADAMQKSLASFNRVLQTGETDVMVVQRHDVRRPESEGGGFETRYWSPINSPIFNPDGSVAYIFHRVENVTDYVLLKQQGVEQAKQTDAQRERTMQVEAELYARSHEVAETSLKLKEANSEQNHLLDLAHVLIRDLNDCIISWNTGAQTLYGFSKEEAIGHISHDLLKTVFPISKEAVAEALETTGDWEGELVHTAKDGHKVVVASHQIVHRDDDGKPVAVIEVNNDVTERKKAETALLENESRYRNLFNMMPSGVAVYEVTNDGNDLDGKDFIFTDMNPAGERIDQVHRAEIIGKSLYDFFPNVKEMGLVDVFRRVWQTGVPEFFPVTLYADEKLSLWITNYVWRLPSGELVALFDDITERKKAEEALRISEDKFAKAFATNPAAIAMTRLEDGLFIDVNDTWVSLTEYSRDEAIGHSSREMNIWPTKEAAAQFVEELKENGSIRGWEQEFHNKSGEIYVAQLSAQILDINGETVVLSTLVDITARKKAEEAVVAAHRQAQNIIDNTTSLVYAFDLEEHFLLANVGLAKLLRSTPEQMIGKRRHEFMPKYDADWHEANDRQVIELGKALEFEEGSQLEDRSITWLTTKFPLRDAQGRIYAVAGISTDVSERKKAEEARDTTIGFLQMVNTSSGITDLIHESVNFFKEQSGCEAVGIRLRDGEDYPYYETHGFPEEFVLLENSLCSRCDSGEIMRDSKGYPIMECMCGNIICGRSDPSKPFFSDAGSFWSNNTTELLASTTDADRQARTRNRCNGEGYESVALIAIRSGEERLGLIQLNDRRKGMFTSETIALWERFAGYLAVALAKFQVENQLSKSNKELLEANDRIASANEELASSNEELASTNEELACTNEELRLESLERRRADQALRESEQRFRTMADAIPQLAWIADPDGSIFWYNQRWYEYTGTKPEQMEGWGWQSVHDPEMLPKVLERWMASIATGEPFSMEFPLLGADGKFRIFLTRVMPMKDTDGRIIRWFGTNTDVSEAREAEAHKLEFYQRTILAATNGKLVITEKSEITKLVGAPEAFWVIRKPEDLKIVRHGVEYTALSMGIEEPRLGQLAVVVGEAAMNVVKHADNGTASVHQTEDSLMVVISDNGPGIPALALPNVALTEGYSTAGTLGMGYKLMLKFADKIYLATDEEGTTVGIEMKLHPELPSDAGLMERLAGGLS